jgi:hypothetical protein
VVNLLDRLRAVGAAAQVTVLAARAVAGAALEDPLGVANLLDRMREAGAEEQVTKLLDRNPAAIHAPPHAGSPTESLEHDKMT